MSAKLSKEYGREDEITIRNLRAELASREMIGKVGAWAAGIIAVALVAIAGAGLNMWSEVARGADRFAAIEVNLLKISTQIEKQREESTERDRRLTVIETKLDTFTQSFALLSQQVSEYRKEQQGTADLVKELLFQSKYPSTPTASKEVRGR